MTFPEITFLSSNLYSYQKQKLLPEQLFKIDKQRNS